MAASHAKTLAADSDSDEELQNVDICRVCRCEGTPDHPLFFPCVCTGSIKYIHQDCLVEWLKYSKKEYCELCKHKFRFTPIYADNMPSRLPIYLLLLGLFGSLWSGFKTWSHYTIVALAWLIVVPVFACRVHRCMFHRSIQPLITLPGDLASFENLPSDLLQGGFLVTFTLCAFIALVWLRDQIGQAAPQWLPVEAPLPPRHAPPAEPQEAEIDRGMQAGVGLLGVGPEQDWHDVRRNDEDTDTETDETDWSPFGSSSFGHDGDYVNMDQNELRRRSSPFAPAADASIPLSATQRRAERADEPGPSNRSADTNLPGPANSNGTDLRAADSSSPFELNGAATAVHNTDPIFNENLNAQRYRPELENGLEEPTWERLLGLDGSWRTERADQPGPSNRPADTPNAPDPANYDRPGLRAAADAHRPEQEGAAAAAAAVAAAAAAPPPPPAPPQNVNPNLNANEQEDAQRNQQELERAAEELTWERLLGLDGSWVFLEHVLWVISLNTVCVILFVFAPFHFGLYLLERFDVSSTQVAPIPAARFTLMSNATTAMFAASQTHPMADQYRIASDMYLSAQSAYLNVTGTYLQLVEAYTGIQVDSDNSSALQVELDFSMDWNSQQSTAALVQLAKHLSNLQLRLPRGTQIEPDLAKLNALTANLTLLVTAMSNVTLTTSDSASSATDLEKGQVTFRTLPELQLALITSDLPRLLDTALWLDEAITSASENETDSNLNVNNSTQTSNITDDRQQESANERKDGDANVVLVNSLEKLGYLGAALITLVGYVAIGCCLLVAYVLMTLPRAGSLRRRVARLVLLAYIVVKVALLVTLEIGIFPLCVGWWIDVCTLPLFGSSWSDRVALFGAAPGTVCFLHWIVGMIYVFYFASFVILLREVLRPGVLWFLRNLNDPEFNPIHEMIVQPATRHVRRFISSCVLFGTSVIFVLYAPVRLVRLAMPAFLPFNVHHSDAPVNEISYSFLVLNLILPVLLEHVQLRAALKTCVRRWCIAVGWALDLRSYLLGDQPTVEPQPAPNPDPNPAPEPARPEVRPPLHENLAARHRAMLMDANAAERIEANSEADGTYMRPRGFALRVVALVGTMWLSLSILGTLLLTVPVATGRALIAAWLTHVNGMRLVTVGDELADSDADADDIELQMIANRNSSLFNESVKATETGDRIKRRQTAWSEQVSWSTEEKLIGKVTLEKVEDHEAVLYFEAGTTSETGNETLTDVMNASASLNTSLAELASASGDLLPVYVHELYTTALGLYMWWIVIRLCSLAEEWYKKNATEIVRSVKTGCIVAAKAGIVCVLMLGVLPILIGLLFDLVVIIPLRVATNQTPIYNVLNHWTFGILHMKILAALTAIGPQWWLRDELELLYANGLRNIRLTHTLSHLCYPLMASLGMALAVPYVLARTIFPLFSDDLAAQHYVLRNVYPATLSTALLLITVYVHLRQLRRLYEHIRNEHYLIGQRLVNYEQPSN